MSTEYKLSPAFSVNAGYTLSLGDGDPFFEGEEEDFVRISNVSLEGRWYHDMKRRIREGRSANNIGGRYLGLEGLLINGHPPSLGGYFDQQQLNLRYGVQQRWLRYGYIDVSLGVGIGRDVSNAILLEHKPIISTDQRLNIGLGLFMSDDKDKVAPIGSKCDILHCFDEQYSMWKIDLFNAFSFTRNRWGTLLNVSPNLAYEQKLGRSPFSIEGALRTTYSHDWFNATVWDGSDITTAPASDREAYWKAQIELRWYYNMEKRILSGKSGNNLSGAFVGAHISKTSLIGGLTKVNYPETIYGPYNNYYYDNAEANIVWGYQQRLLDRGFIQFKIGTGVAFAENEYHYRSDTKIRTKTRLSGPTLNVFSEVKVGLAF
jgi:hypothetical protein